MTKVASPAQMAALYERYNANPSDVWQKPEEAEKEWLDRIRGGADFTILGSTKEALRGPKEGQSEADWKRRWYTNQCNNLGKTGESRSTPKDHPPTPAPPSPHADTDYAPPRNHASRRSGKESKVDYDSDGSSVKVRNTRQNAWKLEKKDMQSKMDQLVTENTRLEDKNTAVQKELDELRRSHAEKVASLDARKKALDERESALRKEFDDTKRLQIVKENSLKDWEASLNVREQEAKKKAEHIAGLQRQLMATRTEKENAQQQLRETSAQRDTLANKLQECSKELDAERQKLETTRDKLMSVQSERADLKEQNGHLHSMMEARIDNYKILFDGLIGRFVAALDEFKRNDSPSARESMMKTCQQLLYQLNVASNDLASTSTQQSTTDEGSQRSLKRSRTE